ncbi:MAG: head maturation protease, ClpP-related [Pseudomonadota bacterium]
MKPNKLLQLLRDNARADASAKPAPLRAEVKDDEAHIYVYDVIDSWWGANAAGLVTALAAVADKTVHLHINSPGGDVFEARAMSAAIVAHAKPVIGHIDGVAASAATYLALACSEVRMTDGGLFMVHNSWTFAYGNKDELRATADLLEKIDGTIAADYRKKTGASEAQVKTWMDAETWFTAQEALDAKFIDAIEANSQADDKTENRASWNLSAYANAPKQLPKPPAEDLGKEITAQLQHNRNRMRLLAQ